MNRRRDSVFLVSLLIVACLADIAWGLPFSDVNHETFWLEKKGDANVRPSDLDNNDLSADDVNLYLTITDAGGDLGIRRLALSGCYIGLKPCIPVPESATFVMLGAGLVGLAALGGKRLIRKR